ncbi:MAG: helix-turn-helix domain-containing protein [Clostridiales bacterium]|nr:helix-turn-helix domain-containing protein [Clostridiales bacterium]
MTMGKRIKSLRLGMDLTLKEMSAMLGVSLNTVYRWEHDLVAPRKGALNRMAEEFQVPLKWLMYGVTVEEGNPSISPDDRFEQNLLRMCRRLSEASRYKILGYAERIWVEDLREDSIAAVRF